MTTTSIPVVQADLQLRINAFYAWETMLLDDGRFDEWLELLTEDIRYRMPFDESSSHPPGASDPTEASDQLPHFLLFNDDYESLKLRVARLATGLAPGESPRTVTQRMVSDIVVTEEAPGEISVRSSVLVFLVRHERHESFFLGRRQDVLRVNEQGQLRLAAREIVLAHSVLPRTISIFF